MQNHALCALDLSSWNVLDRVKKISPSFKRKTDEDLQMFREREAILSILS